MNLTDVENFEDFARELASQHSKRLEGLHEALRGKAWTFQPRGGECVFVLNENEIAIKVEKADFKGWRIRDAKGEWVSVRSRDLPVSAIQQLQSVAKTGQDVVNLEQACQQLPVAIQGFREQLNTLQAAFLAACSERKHLEAEARLGDLQAFYEQHTTGVRVMPRTARRQMLDIWRLWLVERLARSSNPEEVNQFRAKHRALLDRFRTDVCAPCPREQLAARAMQLSELLDAAESENSPGTELRRQLTELYTAHELEFEPSLRSQIAQSISRDPSSAPLPPCQCVGCRELDSLLKPAEFACLVVAIRCATSPEEVERAWQTGFEFLKHHASVLIERSAAGDREGFEQSMQRAFDHAFSHNFPPPSPLDIIVSKDRFGSIVLKWGRCLGAEKYTIQRRSKLADTGGRPPVTFEVEATGADRIEFNDEMVEPGKAYCYWVAASNQCGESSPVGPVEGIAAKRGRGESTENDTIVIDRKLKEAADNASREGDIIGPALLYANREQSPGHLDYLASSLRDAASARVMLWEKRLSAVLHEDELTALEQEVSHSQQVLTELIAKESRPKPQLLLRDARNSVDSFKTNLKTGFKGVKFSVRFLGKLRDAATSEKLVALRVELEQLEMGALGSLPALLQRLAEALTESETRVQWAESFQSRVLRSESMNDVEARRSELAAAGGSLLNSQPEIIAQLTQLLNVRAAELTTPPPSPPTHAGSPAGAFVEQFHTAAEQAETADQVGELARQLATAKVGVLAERADLQEQLATATESARQRADFVARFLQSAETAQAHDEVETLQRQLELGTAQWSRAVLARAKLPDALAAAQRRVAEAETALSLRLTELADQAWRPADLAAMRVLLQDPAQCRLLRANPALQQQLEERINQSGQNVREIQAFLPQVNQAAREAFSRLDADKLRDLVRQNQRLWTGKEALTHEIERLADEALLRVQANENALRERFVLASAGAWCESHLADIESISAEPDAQALLTGSKVLRREVTQLIEATRGQVVKIQDFVSQANALAAQAKTADDLGHLRELIGGWLDTWSGKSDLNEHLAQIVDSAQEEMTCLREFAAKAAKAFTAIDVAHLDQTLRESPAWSAPDSSAATVLKQARNQVDFTTGFADDCIRARDAQAVAGLRQHLNDPPLPAADPDVRAQLEQLCAEAERRVTFAGELIQAARRARNPAQLAALRGLWLQRPNLDSDWDAELEGLVQSAEERVERVERGPMRSVMTAIAVIALIGACIYFGVKFWPIDVVHTPDIGDTTPSAASPQTATSELPWVNSIGMKFVPVPLIGDHAVFFSVWETRVRDFEAFVKATGHFANGNMTTLRTDGYRQRGDTWSQPGFSQTPLHPVCGVNWNDAKAFCDWLTTKERKEGRITTSQTYRLPTDAEWSAAVGIGELEGSGSPKDKDGKIKDVYPWGNQWPPPSNAGNYAGQEAANTNWPTDFKTLDGYRDGFPRTAPVGSFAANAFGIYDLGGNVWELCADWYDAGQTYRLLRGAAWSSSDPGQMLSSYRGDLAPETRQDFVGFRVVISGGSPQGKTTPP